MIERALIGLLRHKQEKLVEPDIGQTEQIVRISLDLVTPADRSHYPFLVQVPMSHTLKVWDPLTSQSLQC